jgi:hypothetical protein
VADVGLAVGAAVFAAAGLAASYLRLRQQGHDRGLALLTILLLGGATPLLLTVVRASLGETAIFAALAITLWLVARAREMVRAAILLTLVLVIPLVTSDTTPGPTLFAPHNGFLALTPVVYLATVAAIVRLRHEFGEALPAIAALVMWPLTETSLVPSLALFGTSLAAALAWARQRPLIAALPVLVAPIVWNYWLMVQYTAGTIPKDAPVSFAAMVRQQADVHTRHPYIYPFALPGSAVSAWRDGVPLSRYDWLASEPADEQFQVRFDRMADRFLLEGWGSLGASAEGSFRPLAGNGGTIVFPLRPTEGPLEIVVLSATRGADAAGEVRLILNGEAIGRLTSPAGLPAEARLVLSGVDVGRIVRAGYNRLTIVPSGHAPIAVYRFRVGPAA